MTRTAIVTVMAAFLMAAGCTNMGKTEQGALSGGAIGAGVGAAAGAVTGGDPGTGAATGGAVGAAAGGYTGCGGEGKRGCSDCQYRSRNGPSLRLRAIFLAGFLAFGPINAAQYHTYFLGF